MALAGPMAVADHTVAAAHMADLTAVAGRMVAAADLTAADRTVVAVRVVAVDRAMAVAVDKRR